MRARIDGESGDERRERGSTVRPEASVRQYAGHIYLFLLRLTRDPAIAADLSQRTMAAATSALSQVEGECGTRMWLHAIALRLAAQYARSRARGASDHGVDDYMHALSQALGEPPRDGEHSLAVLPFDARSALILCCIERYTREEAALLLGTTLENVTAQLLAADAEALPLRELPRDGVAPSGVDRTPSRVVSRLRSLFRSR